jgi:hypothetical protein
LIFWEQYYNKNKILLPFFIFQFDNKYLFNYLAAPPDAPLDPGAPPPCGPNMPPMPEFPPEPAVPPPPVPPRPNEVPPPLPPLLTPWPPLPPLEPPEPDVPCSYPSCCIEDITSIVPTKSTAITIIIDIVYFCFIFTIKRNVVFKTYFLLKIKNESLRNYIYFYVILLI